MSLPEFGLGAAALRRHLAKHDRTLTDFAKAVRASKSTAHAWVHAGWLTGGGLPDALYRKEIERASGGEVPAYLFDLDHARRREHRRALPVAEAA